MTSDNEAPDRPLATVRRLPMRPPAGEVLEGEIVTPQQYAAIQAAQAAERRAGYGRDILLVAKGVRTAATHRHTRAVLRHLAFIANGALHLGRRAWDSRSMARFDRVLRALETQGNHELLAEWMDRREAALERRHKRRMDWLAAPKRVAKSILLGAVISLAVLLALGIILAVAHGRPRDVIIPIKVAVIVAAWMIGVFALLWGLLLGVAVALAVFGLWRIGRGLGTTPAFLAPENTDADPRAILPTTGAILDALRNLSVPSLDRAFKAGWASAGYPVRVWVTDPHRDGDGWRAQIALPQGVTVEMIAKREKRAVLAHNLTRLPVEVWPTEPKEHPGVLDLWVADQGSLTGPVPPWPLLASLDTVCADYFKGVPVGVNIRGDVVNARLFECNYVCGGIMGSGKSTLIIAIVAGAMLDPLVDIDIRLMADNADYLPFEPRLRSLVFGAGPDVVRSTIDLLEEVYVDLQVRGKALREHGERNNSRKLAEKDSRLRPRLVVIDECQALFMDAKNGETAADQAIQLQSAARKYGVTIIYSTPEPTNGGLPRKLVSTASHKACFPIGDQISNDSVLGTGSYKAGVSAVGLEPKTDEGLGDVGTAMTRGFSAKPSLLRCFYITQSDAHRITQRAVQLRASARPAIAAPEDGEVRDLLDDVVTAMGGAERVRSEWLRGQLADRWPDTYGDWSSQDFADALAEAGVEIQKRSLEGKYGQRVVELDEVLAAQAGHEVEGHEDP